MSMIPHVGRVFSSYAGDDRLGDTYSLTFLHFVSMTMQPGVYILTNVLNDLAMDLSGMDQRTPIGTNSSISFVFLSGC